MNRDIEFASDPDSTHWCEIIARCGRVDALDLDGMLAEYDPLAAKSPGKIMQVENHGCPIHEKREGRPSIGVMTDGKDVTPSYVAQLAAFAVEKGCNIVAITSQEMSGLEAYGIRTECLGSGDAEAAMDQIKRLWGIELVI